MFINYTIKNNVIYVELDINYDFGNFKNKNTNFKQELKKYLDKLKIDIKNKKIILVCSGIIIGSIFIFNSNMNHQNTDFKYVPNINNKIIIDINQEKMSSIIEEKENINQELQDTNKEAENSINKNTINNNVDNSNKNSSNNATNNVSNNITNNNTNQSNNVQTIPSGPSVTIYRSNGSVVTIGLEEYVIGVIAAEMPASFNMEAIKAQSVIARTYALKAKSINKTLTDTVSTQAYIDTDQMRVKWGSSFDTYYNKIKNAVNSTTGEYLTYDGKYIEAMYHSTNNGKTESSKDVFGNYYPYLISVTSEYDKSASSYLRTVSMDLNTVSSKLGINLTAGSIIEIQSYTDGDNIKQINIAGTNYTGKQVRELLGLRSADFDIQIDGNIVNITTRGYGHGVGMSQYGANGMANNGYNYRSILSHYYPGTTINY